MAKAHREVCRGGRQLGLGLGANVGELLRKASRIVQRSAYPGERSLGCLLLQRFHQLTAGSAPFGCVDHRARASETWDITITYGTEPGYGYVCRTRIFCACLCAHLQVSVHVMLAWTGGAKARVKQGQYEAALHFVRP